MLVLLRRYFALLARYLRPQWVGSLFLALFLFGNAGLQLLKPQLLKLFIDTALAHGVSLTLLLIACSFIGFALLNQGIAVADSYLGESIAWTATNQLRTDLVAHCLSLDLSFHKERSPGELIERIDGDVDTLSHFFSRLIIQLGGNILLLCGILAIFFRIDWRAGLGASVYALIFLSMLMVMRRRLIPLWVAQRQASAEFYGFLGERLEGTAEIRANGATTTVLRRFLRQFHTWFPITYKARMSETRIFLVNFAVIASSLVLTLILGAYLRSFNPAAITIGTIFAMYTYAFMLVGPIWTIQTQLQDLQQVEACIQRIYELFSTTSRLHDGSGATFGRGPLALEFEHVTFGYEGDVPVLRDLTFAVQPGQVLGILGRTGSGKTTLARLIFRLYDAQQGCVRLDGVSVQQTHLQTLRQHIGLVTQDVQLFQASVRDNLTFFNRGISDERILTALENLGLSAWYQSLPTGLDTVLPTGALSAGEAQLLAFTRVFLQDPGIIILDEASSRLDPATAALLEKALDTLFDGRTAIVIAHRLSTIQRANEILILEDGAVLEYGSYDKLAHDVSSRFFHLLQVGLEEVLA
ncbi:ABC transporter ATP-binding protein [Tengunoibacter tsumagoiensis]|uniref:Helicase n=1 Tax=Tengunoibacter tsumagoiensis TaxID=2014871 RepID=A0A402A8B4_9CHLR|nr:ABC transporter ATP-binding protein [Tengunoibacter tsumagoiensis]GCE15211.1 helicase [Tengunoibacter tsumagoiensis]